MLTHNSLGPTQRAALLAGLRAPDHTLRRGLGGWWLGAAPNGAPASFTVRTIMALSRAYLIDLQGPYADTAPLTRKGLALALQLTGATR